MVQTLKKPDTPNEPLVIQAPKKLYRVIKDGEMVETEVKGELAGITTTKKFGRLDCKTGMHAKKEHRVFFATLEDAVKFGYTPCNHCRPIGEEEFDRVRHLVAEKTLYGFYHRAEGS